MTISRRSILAGLSGLGLSGLAGVPAWAQAIGRQSDPWAQVDPYADARNGFPVSSSGETVTRPADGFFSAPPGTAMDEAEEVELGRAFYPQMVAKRGGAHPDARLQAALRKFCQPLFAVADRQRLPWEVTLVNDPSPNAAAFAGGKIVVHAGLLPLCDNGGELAATVAHEIGHVDKYHTVRARPMLDLIARLRASGAGADFSAALPQLLAGGEQVRDVWELFRLSYSREDETEADAHEMTIFERLGVDPIHAVRDQENFVRMTKGKSGGTELTLTHPQPVQRLERIRSLAAMSKRPAQDYAFAGWEALKAAYPTLPDFKKT